MSQFTRTDASIDSATGSSQVLLAGTVRRGRVWISNPSASVSWWINESGGTAVANDDGCFELPPGARWSTDAGGDITGIATAGTKLTIKHGSGESDDVTYKPGGTPSTPLSVTIVGDASSEYETVAASQTDQVLGATGALGDKLSRVLIVPATTSPGAVSIKDGSGSAITIFVGGAASVASLVPFSVPLDLVSLSGAWKITTGLNVSVIASGNFT